MSGQAILMVMTLVTLGFFGFAIYFIFKMLQFVIQATNLYKKMIERQDMIIMFLNNMKDA